MFRDADVVLFQETHLCKWQECAVPVPAGYTFFAISRQTVPQSAKQRGGVAAFVKKGIQASLSALSSPDIMVLDCGTCWIVNAYLSPSDSHWRNWSATAPTVRLMELLQICTSSGTDKPVIVMGDLNARTASRGTAFTGRSSIDNGPVSSRGRQLLDFCNETSLSILNGSPVDVSSPGSFTSFQRMGNAVVDYAVVSDSLLRSQKVLHFLVSVPPVKRPENWSDHASLTLVLKSIFRMVVISQNAARPQLRFVPTRQIDFLLNSVMAAARSNADALIHLYGPIYIDRLPVTVYTDGSCFNNGTPHAHAGAGVFWGRGSSRNLAARVPGPERQTNNRAEMFAVLLALQSAPPRQSLLIYCDSELTIRLLCYWAAKHSELNWPGPNGDICRDVVRLLQARIAPVKFIWVKAHAANVNNGEADSLARQGAKLPPVPDHVRLTVTVPPLTKDQVLLRTPKVSTTLPEIAVKRKIQQGPLPSPPEVELAQEHRGRAKVRALQLRNRLQIMACANMGAFWSMIKSWSDPRKPDTEVSLQDLMNEFESRMNYPLELPATVDTAHRQLNHELADLLPDDSIDETPSSWFSRPWSTEEIAAVKVHVKDHVLNSASGVDNFSYSDILATPNDALQRIFQACMDDQEVPTMWLSAMVVGILKSGKDAADVGNYRSVALECCMLKFLTMMIDKRLKGWIEENDLLPESQNGFRQGFRTNNNPFVLRCMIERAAALGKPLFVGYVDLKNAFPTTDRPTLWVKLCSLGASGPIIDWVRRLYSQMVYYVRVDGSLSEGFTTELGLLTGDPSSPTFWNLFIADFDLNWHPDDIVLNGVSISKLEHADDIATAAMSASGFQSKLVDTEVYVGLQSGETNYVKTVYSVFNKRPPVIPGFTMGGRALVEKTIFSYVGQWFQTDSKNMFTAHYKICAQKATKTMRACFGIEGFVGDIPLWELRCLYMARVDPYLISGCDICLDVEPSKLKLLQNIQHDFLRRMLGLTSHSLLAVLFSETGIWPIRYRRISLALQYLKYLLLLPPQRYAYNALRDSLTLARAGRLSWVNDVRLVLSRLPFPIAWDLSPEPSIAAVDTLMAQVKSSMESDIQNQLLQSTRVVDFLRGRTEPVNGVPVPVVLTFRHYLRVKTPKHRQALIDIVLSNHQLAMERLRWAERRRAGETIPRDERLCRLCQQGQEDAVHALFLCEHQHLLPLRSDFWACLELTLPGLRARFADPGLLFRTLLAERAVTALLAKFAFEILQVFYAVDMLVPPAT